MPTYEYICDNCGKQFEVFQSIKADALKKCEACGKDTLRRLISGGGGLIFKGTGFYLTDYKNKPSESSSSSSSSSTSSTSSTSKSDSKETKSTETKTESKTETKKDSSSSSASDKSNSSKPPKSES